MQRKTTKRIRMWIRIIWIWIFMNLAEQSLIQTYCAFTLNWNRIKKKPSILPGMDNSLYCSSMCVGRSHCPSLWLIVSAVHNVCVRGERQILCQQDMHKGLSTHPSAALNWKHKQKTRIRQARERLTSWVRDSSLALWALLIVQAYLFNTGLRAGAMKGPVCL